jgi:phage shock protein A
MFGLVKSVIMGASARAEDKVVNHYAIDLLAQRIGASEAEIGRAKQTLASLIMRERSEAKNLGLLSNRIEDLEQRARAALADGAHDLARDAAEAIAELENERDSRRDTVAGLQDRIARMRLAIEKSHRRLVALRQGMIQARAIVAEHKAQRGLERSIGSQSSMREAEELLARIVQRDDPAEEAEVLDEIDAELSKDNVREKLANAGYGPATRRRAEDVLSRLKAAGEPAKT